MICEKCGHELQIGDYPFCTKDGNHQPGKFSVIPDDIPGGYEVTNGICNMDGTPRRYYSKSEMLRVAKERGLEPYVVHQPPKDSDKSPHTSRWF